MGFFEGGPEESEFIFESLSVATNAGLSCDAIGRLAQGLGGLARTARASCGVASYFADLEARRVGS
jgi:hypothetical protein